MDVRATNASRGTLLAERVREARDFFGRLVGLIGRGGLVAGDGLHLVPCRAVHTFFLRTPIDVAFLDEQGAVVKVFHALPPWRATSFQPHARSALELPAGTLQRSGTEEGHRVTFKV